MKLQLTHYGRKGIYAYIAHLSVEGGDLKRGAFVNGVPVEEEKQAFYQGKSVTVEIDLSCHQDGWYEYKEASGHKSRFGYILVKDGEISEELDSIEEVKDVLIPVPLNLLPDLEGTPRQIEWAASIRARAIRCGLPAEVAARQASAKAWIESKDALLKRFPG
jgi:hypothetical protein